MSRTVLRRLGAEVERLAASPLVRSRVAPAEVRATRILHVDVVAENVPSLRMTGRSPARARGSCPGTMRLQLRSPPP